MSTHEHDTTSADLTAPDEAALRSRIEADVTALRESFEAGTTRSLEARLARALAEDLGKSRTESAMTEIGVVAQEITHVTKHLKSWLKPTSLSLGPMLAPAGPPPRRRPVPGPSPARRRC